MRLKILFCFIFLFVCCLPYHDSVYADSPKRIISLAPSITEILFALGLGDRIVGVTNFCDYPEAARKKQKIGGMTNPSLESVISLQPDIVVMTIDGNPKEFEERLRSLKIKTYVFRAVRLSELPQAVRDLGSALDAQERSNSLAAKIDSHMIRFFKCRAKSFQYFRQGHPG